MGSVGFTDAQRAELRAMLAELPQHGLPGPPGLSGPPGIPGADNGQGSTRWNPSDLGFFDPFYDNKSISSGGAAMEYTGKETYFRNMHLFIARVNEFVDTKGQDIVRQNLWLSLRGTTLE